MTLRWEVNHRESHRHLLSTPREVAPGPSPDAIIVPTCRPVHHLRRVADLAAKLNCLLITLHSGDTRAKQASEGLRRDVGLIAIDLPPGGLNLPRFATTRVLSRAGFARGTDTSVKRNLGLVLARLSGLSRIAFVDDDVLVPDSDDLRRAVKLLETHDVVGLGVGGFPDNSVVCHAYRAVGGSQDCFLGGRALVVEAADTTSFFPDIYNEEWFFCLDQEMRARRLALCGTAVHDDFDPFATSERAASEEVGDVLAEGVFSALGDHDPSGWARLGYWRHFLAGREKFILALAGAIGHEGSIEPRHCASMLAALRASRERLALMTPEFCRDYLLAFSADVADWGRYTADLSLFAAWEAAVDALTIDAAPRVTRSIRPPM